jgi:hypothetical protein
LATQVNKGSANEQTPAVLIHDAGIDEYISTMLLTVTPGIDLLGIPSTPMTLAIETWGFNQGWIQRVRDGEKMRLKSQNVLLSFSEQPGFYQYVLELLATSGNPELRS